MHTLLLIPGFNHMHGDVINIHKVLSRGSYKRSQTEGRFSFIDHVSFSGLNQQRDSLVYLGEFIIAEEFTTVILTIK
jgi:hypothetical protein